ncbi:hypothetical protein DSO57_1005440 [Entomophthora muscae]|uniref:Uncharacterized protein n=1 Tax=Entomophthora muscae TaxID=34485 RepID=A0ACC2SKM4_9FUNG|nr:hypothetical protein DSO57_1005440 [Entomophthora muscae]
MILSKFNHLMNTITSILVVLALGVQAQPLGSVADSQSLVRRTHSKHNRERATPTFIPVPVFVNGNAPVSNYRPVSPSYNNPPPSNYKPQPDYHNSQAVPNYGH